MADIRWGFNAIFYELAGRVTAVEINAMLPPQSSEKQPDNQPKYLLESLLNLLVSEVRKSNTCSYDQ